MNFPKITLKSKFPSQMLPQSPRESLPEDSPPFWRPPAELDFFIFTNCISQYHISDFWTGIFSVGSHAIDQCNLSLPLFHTFSANTNIKTMTNTMTMTNAFREHLERTIFVTCDLWNICSEWWENTNWPKGTKTKTTTKTKTMTIINTFREHLQKTILEKLWNFWQR